MKVTIEFENPEQAFRALSAISGGVTVSIPAEEKPAPVAEKKRTSSKSPKDANAIGEAPAPVSPVEPAPGPLSEPVQTAAQMMADPVVEKMPWDEPEVKEYSDDDLRGALKTYADKHSMADAMKLLKSYGISRVGELKDAAKRAELHSKCNA